MSRLVKIAYIVALAVTTAGAAAETASTPTATIEIQQGSTTNAVGPVDHFTGKVRVSGPFSARAPGRASGATVHFDPGARTAWHTHSLGQTLLVTGGVGLVQQEGGPVQEIREDAIVIIPPGVKHWHGASRDHAMTHIAIAERQDDGQTVQWFEKVSDDQYLGGARGTTSQQLTPANTSQKQPSRAQRLFGDVAPKLAQLTDDVLYEDIWKRPGLSPRDRSLITIAALIAMNRPDQLRSHIGLAGQNGLSQDEIVEAITHLAFYAGWPSAVSAATIAKAEFQKGVPATGAAP